VAVRLALIPVFLVIAFSSGDGTTAAGAILYGALGWSDYLDGIAARVTGQYSRLGAIMDPLADRLLVVAGLVVCWHYETLPRWAIAVLVGRELLMLVLARAGMRRGVDIKINWFGRAGVWFTLSAPFFAMLDVDWLALTMLWIGLVLTLASTAQYVRDGRRQARKTPPAPSS
jgi:cardiolipin synthase